jgi:hypothetical protein
MGRAHKSAPLRLLNHTRRLLPTAPPALLSTAGPPAAELPPLHRLHHTNFMNRLTLHLIPSMEAKQENTASISPPRATVHLCTTLSYRRLVCHHHHRPHTSVAIEAGKSYASTSSTRSSYFKLKLPATMTDTCTSSTIVFLHELPQCRPPYIDLRPS